MPPTRDRDTIILEGILHNVHRQQVPNPLGIAREPFLDSTDTKDSIDNLMKKRHLNQDERRLLHKPKSDWESTVRGDVCKSANTLTVDDIILNYI